MKRARGVAVAAVLVLASLPAHAANRSSAYMAPVARGGMVFPVARSNWYSVINFRNDWHAPRMRYIDGKWRQVGVHEGNDVFAEPGTPVLAVTSGKVERVGWTFYSGWRVGIRDSSGNYWFYAHLRRFAPEITPGVRVAAGTMIGEVGNTGYGSAPGHDDEFIYHLHLGIQEPSGRWINPYPIMRKLYRAATRSTGNGGP
jgi:murein DD-endopeptidase MepM/ murein hydrolase activator NlpD